MRSRAYQSVKEHLPTEAVDIETAVAFIKEHSKEKFDATVELHLHLSVSPDKSDQMVRGHVVLPAGAPKMKRVAVITADLDQQQAATEAGATIVGGEDLIKQIAEAKNIDADIVIATPDMMPKIAAVAKILGPKGLMPNPKTDTVSAKPAEQVAQLSAGKLSFKMDQLGNIHEAVGKVSWEQAKLTENITALIKAIRAARPAAARGELLKSITLKSTMGPAVKLSA